jgi:hypothetical protein
MLFLPEPEPEPSRPPLMKNCINEVNTTNIKKNRKDLKKNVDSKHYVQNQHQASSRISAKTKYNVQSLKKYSKIDLFNHACH